jgi:glycosyltransferase involved in cell wall biosynthesis
MAEERRLLPLVSVIVPAYRAERFLAEALDSVLAQTVSDLECIVVDDGSDDGTHAVAADYAGSDSRVRAIQQVNSGPSAARNRGFTAADPSSEYVSFLDADDVWEPDALELLIRALREDRAAAGAHGLARFIDAGGGWYDRGQAEQRTRSRLGLADGRIVAVAPSAPSTFSILILRDILLTPGNLLVRRVLVERLGGFDPALHGNEDWDFALRLTAIAHLAFVDRPILRYRKHPEAMSQGADAAERFARERAQIMRKLVESPDIDEEQRRLVAVAEQRAAAVDTRFLATYASASLRQRRFGRAARYAWLWARSRSAGS